MMKNQRGASVLGIVLIILCLGLLFKLAIGIIPAYVGEYQLRRLIAHEVKQANEAKLSDRKLLESVNRQLDINNRRDLKAQDVIQFVNRAPGSLRVKLVYEESYRYYGNTYIINRFNTEIKPKDAK